LYRYVTRIRNLHISALKLEAENSSEKIASAVKTTRCHNSEDYSGDNHRSKRIKNYIHMLVYKGPKCSVNALSVTSIEI
jgi:hypothetical protein